MAQWVKNAPAVQETQVPSLRREDSLEKEMATHTNIQIIEVPEEEEKKKGYEKIFEEIIVENFLNMEKEIVNQVQEAHK